MSEPSRGARREPADEGRPLVDVPGDIRDARSESDEATRRSRSRPFERDEVSDQGSPNGRGTEDLAIGVSQDDPADPSAPVHPDR